MKKSIRETNNKDSDGGNFFTEDILIYIFTYLPITSIYKFKSVSKVWFSILSDSYFITRWFQFNKTNKSLPWVHYHTSLNHSHPGKTSKLLRNACLGLYSDFLSRHDHGFCFRFLMNSRPIQGEHLHFVGSSNGLVLCYTMMNFMKTYYVCNPLTQKWVQLPSPPNRANTMNRHAGVIGFFSEYSSSYTASCYKVLCITSYSREKHYADIFCSKLGEWKTFQVSYPHDVSLNSYYLNVVAHDDVVYWINGGIEIITYNLNNFRTDCYQCGFVNLPDEYGGFRDHTLGVSEGLISYARINRSQKTLSGWVLKEDKWKLLFEGVELHDILVAMNIRKPSTRLSSASLAQVVGFNPSDRYVVLLGCWNCSWGFDIRTRRFEELYCCPSLSDGISDDLPLMQTPFVLEAMPTILPQPSWIDT